MSSKKYNSILELLDEQDTLQDELNDPMADNPIIFNALGIISETNELINEYNWKPWKIVKDVDMAKVKEELVDILQFWLNLCNELNLSEEEIYEQYAKNVSKVRQRIYAGKVTRLHD